MAYDWDSKPVQFLPNWPNAHAPKTPAESITGSSAHEEALDHVTLNELQQGELYILKIKLIVVALFQGWDDDMCCFSVLRTDLLDELRWSEARYLPNNFDAYLAFDYAGNPPIHLWTKQLRAMVPVNWFSMFEEARHMQRQWNISYWNPEPNATLMMIEDDYQQDSPVNVNDEHLEPSQDQRQFDGDDEQSNTAEVVDNNTAPQEAITTITATTTTTTTITKNDLFLSELPTNLDTSLAHPIVTKTNSTPAMRLQNQYIRSTFDVPQPQELQSTIEEKQLSPAVTKPQTKLSKSEGTTEQHTKSIPPTASTTTTPSPSTKRPEVKQKRSFSSFFLKKKKSKKSLSEDKSTKRKSTPPDAPLSRSATSNPNKKPSTIDIPSRRKSQSNEKKDKKNAEEEVFETLESSNSDTSEKPASSLSSPTIKTPKNDAVDSSTTDKIELFDMESYFDMQATFAFLNNTNIDNFSLIDISSNTAKTTA
ncbi:uncharacterized protein ATC70_002286 [Mucor velutinosus]|uniref:Uncharacterized protein n=1 Tax=Mucor velutinosus TaxID=708070 RepID=A0AAN7HSS8_9FUNG|nr:hypothetical protein ATC70_002286 [Mucor velutinosus]